MELVCGQLLQEELWCNQKVWFNQGTKHETLNVKRCFWQVQKNYRLEEFQIWKAKEERNLLNLGIKGHFARECHKKKQDWKNKFKGSSLVTTTCKNCSKKKII